MRKGYAAFLAALLLLPIAGRGGVQEALMQVPTKDQAILEVFFQYLIRSEPGGYSLLGNKPMSIECYNSLFYSVGAEFDKSLAIEKGWKAWETYKHLFPSQKFVIKREEGKKDIYQCNTICLINKDAACNVVRDNMDLFTQKFGTDLTPEAIVERICDPKESVFLENHLFGILLGFGRYNARMFHRWMQLLDHLESAFTPPFHPQQRGLDALEPGARKFIRHVAAHWRCLQNDVPVQCAEEFNHICRKRKFFQLSGSDWFLDFLNTPTFVDHGGSPEIYESYMQTRTLSRNVFNKTSFLEVVLEYWTGENAK